jgi:phosphopantothenoylcysteine decarboxylase/phosphopantothenate--cysteine ligase
MTTPSKNGPGGPEILVGVGASIAAYKAADVVSELKKKGAQVTVLLTAKAPNFVAPLTLKVLSERPVGLDLFDEPAEWGVGHVKLAQRAQAYLIVAATADLVAKLALGLADDFVTTAALVARCPLLIAPAMNTAMWSHPATRAHIRTLKSRGAVIIDPSEGLLACGDIGAGKLADVRLLADIALKAVAPGAKALDALKGPLSGRRVLVTAGPTREHLDPIRFISNPSSGKMGYALAAAIRGLGAQVSLVSGPVALQAPEGVELIKVGTAVEMLAAAKKAYAKADAFVACAAVSDFRPATRLSQKKKKDGKPEAMRLVPNPDILLTLSKSKGRRVLIGFAAETEGLTRHAAEKLQKKNLDLIVANKAEAFESDENQATLLRPGNPPEALPRMPKARLAERIASELAALLSRPR